MKIIRIVFAFTFISCSSVLYKHNDAMSMLTTKNLIIDRFGEPDRITKLENYDEFYYDFGEFREQTNYFDPKISLMTRNLDTLSYIADFESQSQFVTRFSKKYILFHIVDQKVIYWESQHVNFPVKKE